MNFTRLSNGALTQLIFKLFRGVECMDKVQFHSDPEFNSAVPAGKQGNLKLKRSFFFYDRSLPTFFFWYSTHPVLIRKKRKKTHSLQIGIFWGWGSLFSQRTAHHFSNSLWHELNAVGLKKHTRSFSSSQWRKFLSTAMFYITLVRDSIVSDTITPTVTLNLPGEGLICLGLNDKARAPSLHLLLKHRTLTVLQPCLPASSHTSCIIYVEKTRPGQASIWPSWNIYLSNLAPSLKRHITKAHSANTAPHAIM